jgi:ubiquinone/menaquinone biosynthesis C-methylase UbiE
MSKETNVKQRFDGMAKWYDDVIRQATLPYARHILSIMPPITPTSIIHDNACGTGLVTFEILSRFPPGPNVARPTIYATDISEGMISSLQGLLASRSDLTSSIHVSVQDAMSLSPFSSETFTHSIMNFALSFVPDATCAAREIFRTLKTGGTMAVTTWHMNGLVDLIHRTQKTIRPDLPERGFHLQEWVEEGKLRTTLEQAGFEPSKIRIEAKEENSWPVETVMKVMMSDFTVGARNGLTDEEKERWGEVAWECLLESEKNSGMVRTVAWVAVAKK